MTSEADVLKYLNMAREYPSYFVGLVEKQYNSFINDTELPVS